ncbi:DUF3846 domain-containing protein [Aeromonas lacus]|uniref:DUF3846 domain-containing protein n=1 Tax=Aeromonas lacus TaxID=558884 RepID=UPI00051B8340|nr:DUF3846 domain-containing protein [Aeromonas lacus]
MDTNSNKYLKFTVQDGVLKQTVEEFSKGSLLEQMQAAVQGRIEVARYLEAHGEPWAAVIVNEEGLMDGSLRWYVPRDSWLYQQWPEHMQYHKVPVAFGTVIIVGDNSRDFTGLSAEQLQVLCR